MDELEMEVMIKGRHEEAVIYKILDDGKNALIWSRKRACKHKGVGWEIIPLKKLIPVSFYWEYFEDEDEDQFLSKVKKNRFSKVEKNMVKSYIHKVKAGWACTDGKIFDNCNDAVRYQKGLFNSFGIDTTTLKENKEGLFFNIEDYDK